MLYQLFHAGVLARQRAILLGRFTEYELNGNDAGYDLGAVVAQLRSLLDVPVLTGLPFGHVADKLTLPVGGQCALDVPRRTRAPDLSRLWPLTRSGADSRFAWSTGQARAARCVTCAGPSSSSSSAFPKTWSGTPSTKSSRHALAVDAAGRAIGCGRLLPDGHIGRLAVAGRVAGPRRRIGAALRSWWNSRARRPRARRPQCADAGDARSMCATDSRLSATNTWRRAFRIGRWSARSR